MRSLAMSVLLAALLSACSSAKVKEAPVAETTPQAPAATTEAETPKADNAAVTNKMEIDPLHDPSNILSKRITYFDFDQYVVKPEFAEMVTAHARYLQSNPQAHVVLEGHADERGTREYNLALGQKRAVAVKNLMSLNGASASQIETISYGEEKPAAVGSDESAWSQNRRVEIKYAGE